MRRRFAFKEIAPEPAVLAKAGKSGENNGSVELADDTTLYLPDFLQTLNERIVALRDRDHALGHAALLDVEDATSLRKVLAKAVLPLLREYFYGDDAQLAMVLGHGFVQRVHRQTTFAHGTDEEGLGVDMIRYVVQDVMDADFDLISALRTGGFLGDAS